MAFECDIPCIACPTSFLGLPNDPTNPNLNLSSEAPDVDNFIGRAYSSGDPPLGQFFYAVGCIGWCLGNTQAEADLCAARQAITCLSVNWPVTTVNPGFDPSKPKSTKNNPTTSTARPLFTNTEQTCSNPCPSGPPSSFSVPAGTFVAFSQLQANNEAYNEACNDLSFGAVCLGDISNSNGCIGVPFNATIIGSSSNSLTFSITSGGLPNGLSLSQSGNTIIISGTPTTGEEPSFSILANDNHGNTVTRSYSISVFGISNSTALTGADKGYVYSYQLSFAGNTVGSLIYSLDSGSLPAGLSISASGLITGTPTIDGTSNFSIKVTRGDGLACSKALSIVTSNTVCGAFFTGFTAWNAPVFGGLGGTTSGTTTTAVFNGNAKALVGQTASIIFSSGFNPVPTGGFTCHVTSNIGSLNGSAATIRVRVIRASDAFAVLDKTRSVPLGDGPGTYVDACPLALVDFYNAQVDINCGDFINPGTCIATVIFGPS